MKIALVQQHATTSVEDNLERGLQALETAAENGAKLVCYAELAMEPFYPQRIPETNPVELAQPVPGPMIDTFTEAARRLGVVVVMNLYERDGKIAYDCSPVIDADGTIVGRTRMVHIPDYEGFHERRYYAPGDLNVPVFDTAVGRIGVAICYDRHYPEYMRALKLRGADLVIIPQAGALGEWPEGLYEAEMRVSAFQNGYFTALCNRVGEEPDITFSGESFVCDPRGEVIARAGTGTDEILYCDIDLDAIRTCPAEELFLADRRPDLYAGWLRQIRTG